MPKSDFNGYKVKSAVGKKNPKNLHHRLLTTSGFMQCQPMFYRELIPFEEIDGQYQIWSRLNPLPVPTMGLVDYHYSKFFVRYKDIFPAYDDFYNRSLHMGSGQQFFVPNSPFFTVADLYSLLMSNAFIRAATSSDTDPEDFVYMIYNNGSYQSQPCYWTSKGFFVFKLLTSLGYELSWVSDDSFKHSLLPIFAYGKIFLDHFYPKAYCNRTIYYSIQRAFSYDSSATVNLGSNSVYQSAVNAIFNLCTFVFYDNNGLYQAWDNPSGPNYQQVLGPLNGSTFFDDNTLDPNDGSATIDLGQNYTAFIGDKSALTKFGIQALVRLSDMMKRYQIAGSRYIERFLARFGIPISDTHCSIKLGTDVINVQVGDVESNSDSSITIGSNNYTSVVGDLAGKGVAAKHASIRYKNDSHAGILMGVFSIVPDSGLYQGLDLMNSHVTPEQFYSPEFDQLGVDAIPRRAVYLDSDGQLNTGQVANNTPFGFLPRYFEYCISRNILSGAFRLPRLGSAELSAYHLYRDMNPGSYTPSTVVHSFEFLRGDDANQYNRIFYNANYSEQFIVRFRCNYVSRSFKKSLSDSYEWEDGEGKELKIDANSVTTN